MLLPWQRGTDLRIGCRADSGAVSGFCRHQPALLNKLFHQFPNELICKIVFAVLIAEPAHREPLSNIQSDRARDIQVLAFCPALFQDRLRNLLALAFQLAQIFLIGEFPVPLIAVNAIALEGFRLFHQCLERGDFVHL